MRQLFITLALVLATGPPTTADGWADDWTNNWELGGDLGIEWRFFPNQAQWPGQNNDHEQSLALSGQARWRGENTRASIEPFLRLDSVDSKRSHFDLREAYLAYEGESWEILAGLNKVFWGVTESRHLVDIINQTDLAEDPDQEQKLGQPMLAVLLQRDWGQIEAYVMPWFRERTFPGANGRLRTPFPVNTDHPLYESGADEFHTDIALRWSHYFGALDIGASVFHGTGREPKLVMSDSDDRLQPFYHQVTQFGLDAQYTRDAWLWKLEAIVRNGLDDTFVASVAGLEYTFYGLGGGDTDMGVLVEYLYDERAPSEPVTAFDDDLLVGTRLAWNDASDTTLLAGVILDRSTSGRFFNLEAERRFGEHMVGSLRLRWFEGEGESQPLWAIDRDDYIEFRLTGYF